MSSVGIITYNNVGEFLGNNIQAKISCKCFYKEYVTQKTNHIVAHVFYDNLNKN